MGNKSNNKRKKVGWRKKNAQHMTAIRIQRLQLLRDAEGTSSDKENVPPINSDLESIIESDDNVKSNETPIINLHLLQNVVLDIPSTDLDETNPQNMSDERSLHLPQQIDMDIPSIDLDETNPQNISNETSLHLPQQIDMDIPSTDLDETNPQNISDETSLYLPQQIDNIMYELDYSTNDETINNEPVEGRRIIDVNYFFKRLQELCDHNNAFGCKLSNLKIISEKRKGLLSQFKLVCNMCNTILFINSEQPKSDMDLNKAATSGIISTGIGYSQFSELCAAMDCPSFTKKHYSKIQNETYNDWRKTAVITMEAAAARERDAAIAEGRVKDGIACIDVIADGVWSKRSYNTNFSALSGAAAIIGKRFGEVLYVGVKNKYCCVCARAESKGFIPGNHVCFKNYSGTSTGMESEVLLEGFKQSIPMHNLIYERMIADGDSSTYKKILESRPYSNCSVEKIECKNHILRNMCKKMKKITTETKYPSNLRKKITTQRILAIRKVICTSITKHEPENTHFDMKVNNLYNDINNSVNHAFGNHENCQPYYCTSQKNSEDVTLSLNTCPLLWHRIKFIINSVAAKSRSLMHNCDSNRVESFNAIVAKFVGGKRINFSMRGGYGSRCDAAVVAFNTKRPLSTLHKTLTGRSPRGQMRKLEAMRERQRAKRGKYLRKCKRRFLKSNDRDIDYGQHCQKPDMADFEFKKSQEEFLKNLPSTEEERKRVEVSTTLQRDSGQWLELRRKLLTASNFAKVVNRRPSTRVGNLVKNIVYPRNISNVPSLKHGIDYEATALEQLSSQLNIKIEPCGLFIDKKLPFLGATPDGVVGKDAIVEVKCPITAFKTSLDEAIAKKKVNFWKKTTTDLILNKKHPWYVQVQGQLHITGRQKCIFGVWSGIDKDMKVEIIEKDDEFWHAIEPKLQQFYMTYILPELCDPRYLRNMPIRDISEL